MCYYTSEKPCTRGHYKRYKKDGKCVECHNLFKSYRRQIEYLLKVNHNKVYEKLGYTKQDLIKHIESKFDNQMTWDNYGDLWHIDHSISIKRFVDKEIFDSKIVNNLANLQPMYWQDNLKKSWR